MQNYEPLNIEQLVGQEHFRREARKWVKSGRFPNGVLLHGPPGTGKTTAMRVLFRALLGEWYDEANVHITNASDDRGIDFVRDLKTKVQVKGIGVNRRAFGLDEADGLTPAAQDAMRQIMEDNFENAFFVFTANDISKIRPAIKSRLMVFEFTHIAPEEGAPRLDSLFSCGLDKAARVLSAHGGDMRSTINFFSNDADMDSIQQTPNSQKAALAALSGEWGEMRTVLYGMLDRGLSITHVMRNFHNSLTEFFVMDADTTFAVMAVLGDMVPHMYEWPIGSHSFVDCLVAKLRREVKV